MFKWFQILIAEVETPPCLNEFYFPGNEISVPEKKGKILNIEFWVVLRHAVKI